MRRAARAFLASVLLGPTPVFPAHTAAAEQPREASSFKLGTFEQQGRTFLGLVRTDQAVVDIGAALAAFEKSHPAQAKLAPPSDMRDLIARYDELAERLLTLATEAPGVSVPFVHALAKLRVRPPVLHPETMLNAAVNYTEHESEMAGRPAAAARHPPANPRTRRRASGSGRPDDSRHNPYLFAEAAHGPDRRRRGDPHPAGPGQDRLGVRAGRRDRAAGEPRAPREGGRVVFGYTLENDVSDRGGRGDSRHGSDWLVGKAHDTFAPAGPVHRAQGVRQGPPEARHPVQLSGTLMQDSTTARMTHTVYELSTTPPTS